VISIAVVGIDKEAAGGGDACARRGNPLRKTHAKVAMQIIRGEKNLRGEVTFGSCTGVKGQPKHVEDAVWPRAAFTAAHAPWW
jgi:hypothetical protein